MKGILKRGFEDALGVKARRSVLTGAEIELAQRLSEKHRSRDWIYRMIRGRGGGFGSDRNGWAGGGHHVL